MNMVYLFVYLHLLKFLSWIYCSFQDRNLAQILLDLFLSTLYFLKIILLFTFQLSVVNCTYFYILAWYPVNLLNPLINSSRFFVDIAEIFKCI